MCKNVLGKDVKLFPCKNKLLRLNLPRLPSEGGRVLMQFSETFNVCSYVKFSPKQWGISNNLLLETLSSSSILRFPIVGTSYVSKLPSSLSIVRLIKALMCGLMLLSLLLRRSSFCKQGKFWQKIPSSSVILLFWRSSVRSCPKTMPSKRSGSGIAARPRSFKMIILS